MEGGVFYFLFGGAVEALDIQSQYPRKGTDVVDFLERGRRHMDRRSLFVRCLTPASLARMFADGRGGGKINPFPFCIIQEKREVGKKGLRLAMSMRSGT